MCKKNSWRLITMDDICQKSYIKTAKPVHNIAEKTVEGMKRMNMNMKERRKARKQ